MSKHEALQKLVEQAKADPSFFHSLVFKPEETISKLDYLERREVGMIIGIKPEDIIAGIAGLVISRGGGVADCGASCNDSCGNTCGGSCGVTCASSCEDTCGSRSCGATTSLTGSEVIYPQREVQFPERGFFRPIQRY